MTPLPPNLHLIDVQYNGNPGLIGVYVLRHSGGALLIDCGPGITVPALCEGLAALDLTPRDVSDVLLTHIHLDHAGAAGWWARQGAQIHVHPIGAPHLSNPEKLLASARRIYGADPEPLWGALLPVPPAKLTMHADGDAIVIGGCRLTALATPGHTEHHLAYRFENVCFAGDVGGERLNESKHVRPPTPPPETHFGNWRASLAKLRQLDFAWIALTHFGLYDDPRWHLDTLARALDTIEAWTEREMARGVSPDEFRARFGALLLDLARADGLDDATAARYAQVLSTAMSADGVYRYWNKFRASP